MPTPQKVIAWIEQATHFVKQFTDIDPKRWKGNDAPNPNHFDSIDKVEGGVDVDQLLVWLRFTFTEAGQQHTVSAAFSVLEPGTKGGADIITVDGEDVSADDFVIGFRTGLENWHWYHRVLAIFKFVDAGGKSHTLRFDGDL